MANARAGHHFSGGPARAHGETSRLHSAVCIARPSERSFRRVGPLRGIRAAVHLGNDCDCRLPPHHELAYFCTARVGAACSGDGSGATCAANACTAPHPESVCTVGDDHQTRAAVTALSMSRSERLRLRARLHRRRHRLRCAWSLHRANRTRVLPVSSWLGWRRDCEACATGYVALADGTCQPACGDGTCTDTDLARGALVTASSQMAGGSAVFAIDGDRATGSHPHSRASRRRGRAAPFLVRSTSSTRCSKASPKMA